MTDLNLDLQVIVPVLPSQEILMSMAVRYDHGFIINYDHNSRFKMGYTSERRDEFLDRMHKVYDIVITRPVAEGQFITCKTDLASIEKVEANRNDIVYRTTADRYDIGYSLSAGQAFQDHIQRQKKDLFEPHIILSIHPEPQLLTDITEVLCKGIEKYHGADIPEGTNLSYDRNGARSIYEEITGKGFFKYPDFIPIG